MHTVQILTKSNQNIKIRLLDNPFIDDFVQQLDFVNRHFNVCSYKQDIPYRAKPWNQKDINKQIEIIVDAITNLNDMGLNFPIPTIEIICEFLEPDDTSRQLLNRLHRHFTTAHRSFSHGEPVLTWEDNTPHTFDRPNDIERFTHYVHEINTAVHAAELYFNNDRIRNFKTRYECQIQFNSSEPIDPNNDPQDRYLIDIKQDHFQYFSDQPKFDVWLPLTQIQGKDYWRAYFDCDDPTKWDISTNVQYSGCMAITDRSTIRDPAILEYLKSYGITPGPLQYGMPLGNIIEGKEYVQSLNNNGIRCVII